MNELSGRNAVVTGSSSGIGKAIAVELASAGARVLVHGFRNEPGIRATIDEIEQAGGSAMGLRCDLSDVSASQSFVADCFGGLSGFDIWVNNAGADVLTGEAMGWSFDQKLERLWQVDVRSTIRFSREAGRRMKEAGRGTIINMGWDQAESGQAGDSGEMFSATKGAIMAFTRSLAKSLAPAVRVNCVAPGWIRTRWGESADSYWNERACGESLLARWGTAHDVAAAVRFLVSPAGEFVNGQTIHINGGSQPWPGSMADRRGADSE